MAETSTIGRKEEMGANVLISPPARRPQTVDQPYFRNGWMTLFLRVL